jgi:tRNA1(Val) A37 N6-methylase TrmN6
MTETSEGTLLAGKLRYRQFLTGHRTGFEPVLLAAAIQAKPGDLILEAGTGAGAALLCLAHRIQNLTAIGLEIDPALAALAAINFKLNNFNTLFAIVSDAARPPLRNDFDHILANPPWFDQAGTNSPDAARAVAHHAPASLLTNWISSLAPCLKSSGSMTLILPAGATPAAAAALTANGLAGITIIPLFPRAGRPAKQIIITATRGSLAPARRCPGLILHDETGITPDANAILRGGAGL